MKKYTIKLVGILLCTLFFVSAWGASNPSSPVGIWQTIDDRTHQPAGIVEIWQSNGKYFGKIVKIYTGKGDKPNPVCAHCSGALHNKPLIGMTVLADLTKNNGIYNGGTILDPKLGKTFRCQLTLIDNGMRLEVRGYKGLPLLGRTQVWNRIN